ncbi:MAG: hypothetical protein V2B18_25370 [Pseudomonadota bacterium]
MAQGWTPSRSRIYGALQYQAVGEMAGQMGDRLRAKSEEEIDAERIRQHSNGRIALMKERQDLLTKITKEGPRDTESWVPTLEKSWSAIHDGVLSGITQPDAKQALELELNEAKADLEIRLKKAASDQDVENQVLDFNTNYKTLFTESVEYHDYDEMTDHLGEGLRFLDENHQKGGVLAVATPDALEFEKRKLTRRIVGNFAVQQALIGDDEGIINQVNDFAPRSPTDPEKASPLFGPDELADLHKDYDAIANAAKAEVAKVRTEQSLAAESFLSDKINNGIFAWQDEQGKKVYARQFVVENEYFTPQTKARLLDEVDDQIGYFAKHGMAKPISESAQSQAYGYVVRQTTRYLNGEIDLNRWEDVFNKYKMRLDKEDRESFQDQVYGVRKTTDPLGKEIDAVMKEADSEATKAAKQVLFDTALTDDVESPEMAEFVGDVMRHMQAWIKTRTAEGKPFDSPAFRVERNRVIYEKMDRIDQQDKAEKKPPKRGRWTGRYKIKNKAEYNLLPSGAVYEGPDGEVRTKP